MPYTFDSNPRLFKLALIGDVTMWDLHGALADVNAAEEGLSVIPPRIIDLSAATSGPGSMDILPIIEERRRRKYPNVFKVALIAPREIDVANARIFQILADSSYIKSAIFPSTVEAEAWLFES